MMHKPTIALVALLIAGIFQPATAQTVNDAAHQQFVFAYRLMERGDFRAAGEAFDEYLGRFPKGEKRGDALYYRADILRRAGLSSSAAKLLVDVPKPKLVSDHAIHLLNGQVNIDIGKFDVAIAALEKVETTKLPKDIQAQVFHVRAIAYRAANNLPAAKKQLQNGIKLNTDLKARLLLEIGRVDALLGNLKDAVTSLDQALALKDRTVAAEAAHLAGDLAYKTEQFLRAIDLYKIVLTEYQSSKHFSACVRMTLWAQLKAKQWGPLLTTFRQNVNNLALKDRAVAWYLAGMAYREQGKHTEALTLLQAAADAAAGVGIEDRALFYLAQSQFELKKVTEMKATLARLKKDYPTSKLNANAQFLLAQSESTKGDAARAAARLSLIIDNGVDDPNYATALLQRARLYDNANKHEPAIDDYMSLLKLADEKKGAITKEEANDAELRIIALHYVLKQYSEADAAAGAALAKSGIDPLVEGEVLFRRALTQIKLKKFNESLDTIDTLTKKHPENKFIDEARYYRGMLLMALKRTKEAIAELQIASKSEKLSPGFKAKALRMLSQHMQASGDETKSAEALLRLQKLRGNLSYADQLWLGRYFVSRNEPRRALEFLKPVLQARDSVSKKEQAESLYLTAQCLRGLGDNKGATTAFGQVIALSSGYELQAKLERGRTLFDMGQITSAIEEYEQLYGVRETRVVAAAIYESGRAYRQLARDRKQAGDTQRAKDANEQAATMFRRMVVLYHFPQLSPQPEISFIELAEIAEDSNNIDAAKKDYTSLAARYPDGPYATYGKAIAAALSNKKPEAVHLLKELNGQENLDRRLADRVAKRLKSLDRGSLENR